MFSVVTVTRKLAASSIFILSAAIMQAQSNDSLTLDQCYQLARLNYPLIKQRDLIKKTTNYTLENLSKGYLPQWTSSGQLTNQSDVTSIPFKVPGFDVPTPTKTQYKVYGEIDQTVYDAGNIRWQRQVAQANSNIDDQNLEVQLYQLREQINQLYFGVLLAEDQIRQNELQQVDLQKVVTATQAAVDNGAGYRKSLDEAKVELLKSQQSNIELGASRRSFLDRLGLFINRNLADSAKLERPAEVDLVTELNRPELKVYDYTKRLYDVQEKQLSVNLLPKVNLFFQGGYSQPPLNFLKANPAFYYLGGLRFDWPLSSLYTHKNEKRILELNRQNQDILKETFVFDTKLSMTQQNNTIERLRQTIEKDVQIIALRAAIKNSAFAQAQNGIITVHDYLIYVNDENRARQDYSFHQIQLLNTIYDFKNTTGN
ncbi:MAG: transporter [Bacteroidetes bacterium]|nr:MAG: transporter [Bacteroidota bacterium]